MRRALVGALGVGLVVPLLVGLSRAGGLPARRLEMTSGSAWLASPAQGVLSLIDGPTEQVVGLLAVPGLRPADDVTVAQAGPSAYVVNATQGTVSRVDGARYEISVPVKFGPGGSGAVLEALSGPAATYVIDGTRRVVSVVDPQTLKLRQQLSLVDRLGPGQAVVDSDGRLWTIDGGGVARFDGSGKSRRLDGGGADRRLVLVGGRPVLVDLAGGRAARLTDSGEVRSWSCLDVAAGDAAELAGSTALGRVLAVRPSTGTLVESGGAAGDCGRVVTGIGAPGDRFGAPVESAGFVLVPDWTTGRVAVIDLARQEVVAGLPVTRPTDRLELLVKDGLVFYNDLDGASAGVIQFDGGRWRLGKALLKYGKGADGPSVLQAAGDSARPKPTGGAGRQNPGAAPPPGRPGGPTEPGGSGPPPTSVPDPGGNPPPSNPPPTAPPPTTPPPTSPPPTGPTVPVLSPPAIQDITWDPLTVPREQPVTFTAVVDNAQKATWAWEILDTAGNSLHTDSTAVHMTYQLPAGSPDHLQVRLVVSNAAGASPPVTRPFDSTAGVVPHIDQITADNPTPDAGAQVTFDATGTNIAADPNQPNLVTWTWDITDTDTGAPVGAPQQRPPGPFPVTFAAGHFRVHLVVSRDGAPDDAQVDITVTGRADVTIALAGNGTGRVTGSGGINCPGQCTANFRVGDTVTLTAAPRTAVPFSTFGGWSGPCTGTGTCTFTVTAAQTVTADFRTDGQLAKATIRFHTTDDDKDGDTVLTINIKDNAGTVVATASGTFGTFGDNSDSPTITLRLTGAAATMTSMPGGVGALHVDPNGNDTWRFIPFLELDFGDGTAITAGNVNVSVSEDNRDGTFPI
jgi:hypothetical protein